MDIDTMVKKFFGSTLVELLVVIIIIAVISAISIPSYQKYIMQTHIGTMFHDAEAAKLKVASDFYRLGTYNSYAAGSDDFTTKNSDCVSSITVVDGVITVQGDSTQFAGKDIWIRWTPDPTVTTDLSWQCSYSTDAQPYINSDYCQ